MPENPKDAAKGFRHPAEDGNPVAERKVGLTQGSAAGVADTDGIELTIPPRIASYPDAIPSPQESPPPTVPGGGLVGERTGEQSFLPPGRAPGERGGPALMGPQDFEAGPTLREPDPSSPDVTKGPGSPRREEPLD